MYDSYSMLGKVHKARVQFKAGAKNIPKVDQSVDDSEDKKDK